MYSISRTSNCELLEGSVFLKPDIFLYKGLAFLQPRGSEQAHVFFFVTSRLHSHAWVYNVLESVTRQLILDGFLRITSYVCTGKMFTFYVSLLFFIYQTVWKRCGQRAISRKDIPYLCLPSLHKNCGEGSHRWGSGRLPRSRRASGMYLFILENLLPSRFATCISLSNHPPFYNALFLLFRILI